jgi:membrane protease YdiL (CAAX protease family)
MTLGAALQNAAILASPAAIYAVIVRWRAGLRLCEIASRLGLARGKSRPLLIALAACVPAAIVGVVASSWTKGFQGSMLAPFLDARPSLAVLTSVASYGLIATGFPEELLFRGLIGGALFRRLSFWKANLIQSSIFLLPHLLILIVAPHLWALAIIFPLALGLFAGWARHSSGSIAGGVLVHAVSNMAGALAVLNWAG